ncbi:MAG: FRG domain-containing protein [Syntrophales bacterium]|jgi:hypothetical protein|nr:FRG domain-containing protein [Syntrophales bacterium]
MVTPQPPTFPKAKISNGIMESKLSSWTDFNNVVKKLLNHPDYIYRGHRRNDWDLESTLTRLMKNIPSRSSALLDHKDVFRYAIRGRRGSNPSVPSDDELWSLGQHHGLATPLLDWTASPYVALFFAFAESMPGDETDTRVVLALNETKVVKKSKELAAKNAQADIVEWFRPLSDDNARLVNQNGLFIKSPVGVSIENWISTHFLGLNKTVLAKIYVPNDNRVECLLALNKMNINHATLFPDLEGACKFTNMRLEVDNY